MKQKFLFDKIVIEGSKVKFYTCRHLTKGERLLAKERFGNAISGFTNNGICFNSQSIDNIYLPRNFRQFINCLEFTKLSGEACQYNIIEVSDCGNKMVSLQDVLKRFVMIANKDITKPSEKSIQAFYTKSYAIFKNAEKNRQILSQSDEEVFK